MDLLDRVTRRPRRTRKLIGTPRSAITRANEMLERARGLQEADRSKGSAEAESRAAEPAMNGAAWSD